MKYDAMYFIAKFSQIPDKKWTTGTFNRNGACCALGHCGVDWNTSGTKESVALGGLFLNNLDEPVTRVNDATSGNYDFQMLGSTPKERVINALLLINAGVKL